MKGGLFVRRRTAPQALGTILHIHGLGESGRCFEGLMADERLGGWSHLAPDLPGYGRSPRPPKPLGLGELADVLARWLERESAERVLVLGHSMGAEIGLILAESYPNLVRALVDVEGNLSLETCFLSRKAASYPLEAWLEHGFASHLEEIRIQGRQNPTWAGYHERARLCAPAAYHRNSVELVEAARPSAHAARLAALPMPHLYVLAAGEDDRIARSSMSLLSEAGARYRVIRRSGHWPFIDRPEAFVGVLLDFLEGADPGHRPPDSHGPDQGHTHYGV